MLSMSAFFDITKAADFRRKIADVSKKSRGLSHDLSIFGSFSGKVKLC